MLIYPICEAQIALLIIEKVTILTEYLDFSEVFSKKSAVELFKRFDINKHLIILELGKYLFYSLIYSLNSIELDTLKTYIQINLANGFICPFKSLAGAYILFI